MLVMSIAAQKTAKDSGTERYSLGFGIETGALLAVVLLHFSIFHSFSAAIAAIVATAFVVVLVVAIAVSLVLRQRACRLAALVLWVDALARFAVVLLDFSTFYTFHAAIAAIVVTAFVVVLVVAIAVSLVVRSPAGRLVWLAALVLWVDALARFAVVLLHFSAFHTCHAAIAAIVATAFVVVIVVAIAVALVLRRPAGRLAALVLWVDALAHFAVLLVHGFSHTFHAAIAAIVATAFVVVIVVAIAVSLVLRRAAGVLALAVWVDALARLAVILLHFATVNCFGTTVAAIISTSFVVVTVVAIAVSLVL